MPDPSLTPHGEEQCRRFAQTFPYRSKVSLIVASPLRRTIQTAMHSFPQELEHGVKIVALPELQETSDLPCDRGSDINTLQQDFGHTSLDLSLVKQGWDSKRGQWAPEAPAIEARAKEARIWLRSRAEEEIVVVTHGGFLHFLTEDWTDSRRFEGTGWANCEYRSYRFSDTADPNASMDETTESRFRRSGTEKPLTKTERIELRETAMKTWENAGYQASSKA